MSKNELNVEDLVFNDEHRESEYLELPLSRQTFFLVAGAVVIVGLLALARVGFLNIANGAFYTDRANGNVDKTIALPAPRGIITDRFGNPLVENKNAFSAFLNAAELLKQPQQIDPLVKTLGEIFALNPADIRDQITGANLERSSFIPVARDITAAQAIQVKDLNLPYLQVTNDYVRKYPDGPMFSHVLGYVGITDKDNTIGGKAGLEAEYDQQLRGADGKLIIYRDASGKPIDSKVDQLPAAGTRLVTTIDGDLQRFFYSRLKQALAMLGRQSGAGIAIDPRTGQVLAMVSLPSYDDNNIAKYLTLPNQPLFNRAVSGVYTPGSTIKPLVGLAALHENIVDPNYQIYSPGFIELPNPYDPAHPSRFLDWRPQGWVDLHSALARSSNVYFYEVGGGFGDLKGLGIDKLNDYWRKFLIGSKTGIDLPGEGTGLLPNPVEKEQRTGQIWRIGDTYNVSIGQGDLMFTPIQLINFIASIANGGRIYRPSMLTGQPLTTLFDYSSWTRELGEVRAGLRDTVTKSYGTAYTLNDLPFPVSAKTGSSQVSNNTKTNAFFVGYAPSDDPQIAVLVLIENAKEGSLNAVPIAKDVFQWYYDNRIANGKNQPQPQ